jgi:hypothetical protein
MRDRVPTQFRRDRTVGLDALLARADLSAGALSNVSTASSIWLPHWDSSSSVPKSRLKMVESVHLFDRKKQTSEAMLI